MVLLHVQFGLPARHDHSGFIGGHDDLIAGGGLGGRLDRLRLAVRSHLLEGARHLAEGTLNIKRLHRGRKCPGNGFSELLSRLRMRDTAQKGEEIEDDDDRNVSIHDTLLPASVNVRRTFAPDTGICKPNRKRVNGKPFFIRSGSCRG